jgi:MFS family permease
VTAGAYRFYMIAGCRAACLSRCWSEVARGRYLEVIWTGDNGWPVTTGGAANQLFPSFRLSFNFVLVYIRSQTCADICTQVGRRQSDLRTPGSVRSPIMPSAAASAERQRLLPTEPTGTKPHHNLANLPPLQFRLLCLSIWTGTFLSALDGTIIATLLTPIGSSFNASNQVSWLGTSYLLSVCVFTPIYGRLADIFGRRAAHLTALTFFTIGTILCAVASSMGMLIAARVIAGIGGGGINTVGVIIMTDLVDLRRRGMFQGYANIFFGVGAALGGPVGGWISDTIGWRAAFWVQPPFLLLAGIGIWVNAKRTTPEVEDLKVDGGWRTKLGQIDWAGLLLLIVGVGSLLLAMSYKTSSTTSSGEEYKWSNPLIYGLLITSTLALAAFVVVEGYFARTPVLPLSLLSLRRRTPLGVAISNFFMTLSQFSLLYNVPLYFSTVHADSSSVSGAHLLPNSIMICFGSLAVGWAMRKTGRYWYLTLACCGLIVFSCAALCTWEEGTKGWMTWAHVAPGGFGYAGVLTTSLVALMSDVTREGKGEQ